MAVIDAWVMATCVAPIDKNSKVTTTFIADMKIIERSMFDVLAKKMHNTTTMYDKATIIISAPSFFWNGPPHL